VSLFAALVLGVVQGLTEFLPVSSSAHLILARAFVGWDAGALGLPFDVAIHLGTLSAVAAFFARDLVALVAALPRAFHRGAGPDVRRLRRLAVGTLPVVIAGGVFWSDAAQQATRTPAVAATMLLAGAALLFGIERWRAGGGGEDALTAGGALAIGVAQAAALVPGVSRSGATIAAGMACGLRREAAARFAFLLSVPAILAASLHASIGLAREIAAGAVVFGGRDAGLFAVGMITSGVVGYLTVKYLIEFLGRHRLDVFAWYRVVLALATFAWLEV
jgi:undecaprenyl-diphosphatase